MSNKNRVLKKLIVHSIWIVFSLNLFCSEPAIEKFSEKIVRKATLVTFLLPSNEEPVLKNLLKQKVEVLVPVKSLLPGNEQQDWIDNGILGRGFVEKSNEAQKRELILEKSRNNNLVVMQSNTSFSKKTITEFDPIVEDVFYSQKLINCPLLVRVGLHRLKKEINNFNKAQRRPNATEEFREKEIRTALLKYLQKYSGSIDVIYNDGTKIELFYCEDRKTIKFQITN